MNRDMKTPTHPMNRREFLRSMGAGTLAFATGHGGPRRAVKPYFTWAQLQYPGSWNPNPRGPERMLAQIRKRTSVEAALRVKPVGVGALALFSLPFLYVAGRGDFPNLGSEAAGWLRRYVDHGGMLFFDDASGVFPSRFSTGVEKLLAQVTPGRALKPLSADHTIFRSFYLLDDVPGRKVVRPVFTGVEREDLSPVIFCANDLGGAWEGDPLGGYTYPCIPGGERQRELSFRMGINLIMYAMTGNYKKDQVHIPFILKRRKRP